MYFNLELTGTFSKGELEKLDKIKDIAAFCRSMGNIELAMLCDRIHEIVLDEWDTLDEYNEDDYYDSITIDEPENLAAGYRCYLEEFEKNRIALVGGAKIKRGIQFGSYIIMKGSFIPLPLNSLPNGTTNLYYRLRNDGLINEHGYVTGNIEVKSGKQVVGLALGYNANANVYLPYSMLWK